jgi:hypothetical protein
MRFFFRSAPEQLAVIPEETKMELEFKTTTEMMADQAEKNKIERAEEMKRHELFKFCQLFMQREEVTKNEGVYYYIKGYDSYDRIYELLKKIGDIVGYYEYPPEPEDDEDENVGC